MLLLNIKEIMTFHKTEYETANKLEQELLPYFKRYFNDETLKNMPTYAPLDYDGEKCSIELKQRNVFSKTYCDVMMPISKLKFASNLSKDVYFVIGYRDGLFSWKFDKDAPINYRSGGRNDRGYSEIKDYAYIPSDYFQKMV